ncbi:MAG TPA: TatD family hydrolase [Candidatus Dormibacteraeota bacterium]|jgi:TatD DNase family protein
MTDGLAPLIDTHCHLVLLDERGLLDAALEGAAAARVEQIISVGLNLEDSDQNRVLAERYPNVYFTCGWHPHERVAPDARQLDALAELLRHPKAVAVGEVGLDLFFRPGYHEVPLEVQERSFRAMLELAHDAAKPVLIHDRDAHTEVLAALDGTPGARGVMHCFSGDAAHARRCAEHGFVASFSGIVTFPRSGPIQDAARTVADDGFVVETDSPFLSPAPQRGTVNLPERVAITAAAVARLRGATVDEVRTATTRTARRILDLPIAAPARA